MIYLLWLLVLVPGETAAKWEVIGKYDGQDDCYTAKDTLEKRIEDLEIPVVVLKCQKMEGNAT